MLYLCTDTALFFPYPLLYKYIRIWTMMMTTINEIQMVHKWMCACKMNEKWKVFGNKFFFACSFILWFLSSSISWFSNSNKNYIKYTKRLNAAVGKRENCCRHYCCCYQYWNGWRCHVTVFFFTLLSPVFFLFSLSRNLQFSFVIKCCSVIYLVIYMGDGGENAIRNRNVKLK